MKAVSLVGYKKSGKTSLALQLCQLFKERGQKVAAAKFSHHQFDKIDSDTQKLSECITSLAGISSEGTYMYWSDPKYLPDLLPLMPADILIIEGGKHLQYLPRIVLPRAQEEVEELHNGLALGVWSETINSSKLRSIKDLNELADLIMDKGFILPGLDCSACGREECSDLAREIVAGKAEPEECQALRRDLEIMVNGHPLALNPFVRSIIAGGLAGMLSSLKGFAPGKIDIHMENT